MALASVAIPLPFDAVYTYRIPGDLAGKISVGHRVMVPLKARKEVLGYVIDIREGQTDDIKPISDILEEVPVFPPELIPLYDWLSRYYVYPIGKVIQETLPLKGRRPVGIQLRLQGEANGLSKDEVRLFKSISKKKRPQNTNLPFIREMVQKGYLGVRDPCVPYEKDGFQVMRPSSLNRYQAAVLEEISAAIEQKRFQVFLLHGVTGSGKTEVYIKALEKALSLNRSGILLVPEIALGLYMESILREAFGKRLSVYHSGLADSQRQSQWMGMLWGHYSLVLGARSAVFSPFREVGLIIVDEEHEDSYKQEKGLRYNGRDVAVLRGMLSGCPVILGSATPSVRSYYNALSGKYRLLEMPERVEKRPLPTIELVDMATLKKETKAFYIISPAMQEAISNTLGSNRQVIVFHSRRGYFRMFLCQTCGNVLKCPDCDVSMIYHLEIDSLLCHNCNKTLPVLTHCPVCKKQTLKAYGYGTERIVEELKKLFPNCNIERVDTDALRSKDIMNIIQEFRENKIQILVGTQLITKGYDFPNVTLVCVISSDTLLNFPDYRSSERTFSTIAQVAGRAGRGNEPGLVLIQSYNSWHHSITCAIEHDYKAFYEKEIVIRQKLLYPPFSHMVMITLAGEKKVLAFEEAKKLKESIKSRLQASNLKEKVLLYGPTPNPISKLKNRYRFHLLIKTNQITELTSLLKELDMKQILRRRIQVAIDVDPYDML